VIEFHIILIGPQPERSGSLFMNFASVTVTRYCRVSNSTQYERNRCFMSLVCPSSRPAGDGTLSLVW